MNVFARFVGIITSPGATYESVVANPRWFGMFVLTTLLIAFGATLPTTTEAGKQASVDQQVAFTEGLGFQVSDQQYEAMVKQARFLPYTTAASVVVGSLFMVLLMAAILWAIFNAAMGGDATYKQILTVLVHSSAISALGQLFTGPLNFFRGSAGSATNLTVLLPMIEETSFVGRLAGAIDLFVIWWIIVLSIGLAVLYRRKTQPIAITLFALYACIALGIAAVMAR